MSCLLESVIVFAFYACLDSNCIISSRVETSRQKIASIGRGFDGWLLADSDAISTERERGMLLFLFGICLWQDFMVS